eukprot:TRINITY_DN14746_c0_g1::TRINITY_DN14746_c0_g1_i1::g.30173::m.30173 TRINITY_DN14746_c0_g1::TRINITY_DN14746_c0_g1_i1::g.30173  ORF type:complete len:263 (+),score=49.51,sp/Q9BSR8/YIPF4_HUMAN/46.70/1e-61,Yip1/PF04893.12/2.3e+03,Yip1/PF04893.12/5e-07,DUF1282/PF06930.7/0.032,PgaD/PF13994.1/5.5 TRINITY_DN14746_c0_g1_i1:90-791(+)
MAAAELEFVSAVSSSTFAKTASGSIAGGPMRSDFGGVSSYFNQKGYGWMLEVEDDDESELVSKPILEELEIDIPDILRKVRCVLIPNQANQTALQTTVKQGDDFWGPFFVCLLYSTLLVWGQLSVFSWVLLIWLCGSLIIFLLVRVLGGDVSYTQTLAAVGYSLLPLVAIIPLLFVFAKFSWVSFLLKSCASGWASYSCFRLLESEGIQSKRLLVMYPVALLYVYFLVLHSGL